MTTGFTSSIRVLFAAPCLLAGLLTCSAPAEEPPVSDRRSTVLPEITVSTSSISTGPILPGSSTELTGSQLKAIHSTTLHELAGRVPSISINDAGSRSFNNILGIRGLTNTQYFSDSSVAVYLDGIPMGKVFTQSTKLFDLESVVVHKGARATMFGQNNEAGVILMTTKPPGDKVAGSISAGYGSYNAQTYTGSASFPIIPGTLAIGIAGHHDSRDGFLYNELLRTNPDSRAGTSGRIHLRWSPSRQWEFTLLSIHARDDDGEQRISPLRGNPYSVSHPVDGESVVNANTTGLKARYKGDTFEFTSVSAYNYWALDPYLVNFGFAPNPEILQRMRIDDRTFSEEIRFTSLADEKESFWWTTGLFVSTQRRHVDLAQAIPAFGIASSGENLLEESTYAGFGHLSIPIGNGFRASAGVRLDYRQKSAESNVADFFGNQAVESMDGDFFNAVPSLGVTYELDSLLMYVNSSMGFKSGGFVPFQGASHLSEYETEKAWSSEFGFRKSFLDRRYTINGSLYYTNVWDYQFERFTSPVDYHVINLPGVEIAGGELELLAFPLPGLEAGIGFNYSVATITDRIEPGTFADHAGNRVPYVPEYKCVAHLQYQHGSGFMGRVESELVGETFHDEANTPFLRQAPYFTLHAKIGYTWKNGGIYLSGRNLTDKTYHSFKSAALGAGTISEPRTIGIEARLLF